HASFGRLAAVVDRLFDGLALLIVGFPAVASSLDFASAAHGARAGAAVRHPCEPASSGQLVPSGHRTNLNRRASAARGPPIVSRRNARVPGTARGCCHGAGKASSTPRSGGHAPPNRGPPPVPLRDT